MCKVFPRSFDMLTAPAPALADTDVTDLVREHYGVDGQVSGLPSERDQNFKICCADGPSYVFKIANAAEHPGVTDFQAKALEHIAERAPDLAVPKICRTVAGDRVGTIAAGNSTYTARLSTWIDGTIVGDTVSSPELRRSMGRNLARLSQSLRGFNHPHATYELVWDLSQASALKILLDTITDRELRGTLQSVLRRFDENISPCLSRLRAQVNHNDFNPGNVLTCAVNGEKVTGVIDFGDMIFAPVATDVAIAAAYHLVDDADPLRGALDLIAAYHNLRALEERETDLLYDLLVTRLASTILIANWRAGKFPENATYILRSARKAERVLKRLETQSRTSHCDRLRQCCGFPALRKTRLNDAELQRRRENALGPAYSLFYDQPLHLVHGNGAWLYDTDGTPFLDVYNNVPHVGHCHPRVVNAIAAQANTLNTHTRYLSEPVVALAERLTAKFSDDSSVAMFSCSGSEANELALRIARTVSGGQGVIVSEYAYHGTSQASYELSTDMFSPDELVEHVVTVPSPDTYRGLYRDHDDAGARYASHVSDAISKLKSRGIKPAAFVVDTIFSSEGIVTPPLDYLRLAQQQIHEAGGYFIADEVQAGFGRTGEHFWGFEAYGLTPDIVTMGKPMGNGHPISALICGADLAAKFSQTSGYFNTFGGNPVSCAAALAVLDIIDDEQLQENAQHVGRYFREGLRQLSHSHEIIGDVRGRGLFIGVDLVRNRDTREPATAEASKIANALKEQQILCGVTGRFQNVLKFRPPLVFSKTNADTVIDRLDQVLRTR